jgi:branched-subunit amino acid transport protein
MNIVPLIMVAAILLYGCRVAGFVVDLGGPSVRRDQLLRFVPLSVLPALITISILRQPDQIGGKIVALVVVGVIVLALQRRRTGSEKAHSS